MQDPYVYVVVGPPGQQVRITADWYALIEQQADVPHIWVRLSRADYFPESPRKPEILKVTPLPNQLTEDPYPDPACMLLAELAARSRNHAEAAGSGPNVRSQIVPKTRKAAAGIHAFQEHGSDGTSSVCACDICRFLVHLFHHRLAVTIAAPRILCHLASTKRSNASPSESDSAHSEVGERHKPDWTSARRHRGLLLFAQRQGRQRRNF